MSAVSTSDTHKNVLLFNICLNDAVKTTGELEVVVCQFCLTQDLSVYAIYIDGPSLRKALNGVRRERWLEAIRKEVEALRLLNTCLA